MNRAGTRLTIFMLVGGIATMSAMGCVTSGTHEQAVRNVELRLQSEQRLAQELITSNKELRFRVAELEATLRGLREQFTRTDKDWKDARDELLRIKMEKEQSTLGRERFSYLDRPDIGPENRLKPQERAEDAVQRARELLRQLQIILEQFIGREPL